MAGEAFASITMVDVEATLEREINDGRKQADIVTTYAWAILNEERGETVDWRRMNDAIVKRWSMSGLNRIKTLAWKKVEQWKEASNAARSTA